MDFKDLVTLFVTASAGVTAILGGAARLIAALGTRQKRKAAEQEAQAQQQGSAKGWEVKVFKALADAQREEITRCTTALEAERADRQRERDDWAQERDRIHADNERLQVQLLEAGMRPRRPNENGDPR